MPLSKCKPAQPSQAQQATLLYGNMFKLQNKLNSKNIVVKGEHSRDKRRLESLTPLQMESAYQHKDTFWVDTLTFGAKATTSAGQTFFSS